MNFQYLGAPFLLEVGGQPSGKMRTVASRQIQSCEVVAPNTRANLMMTLPGEMVKWVFFVKCFYGHKIEDLKHYY